MLVMCFLKYWNWGINYNKLSPIFDELSISNCSTNWNYGLRLHGHQSGHHVCQQLVEWGRQSLFRQPMFQQYLSKSQWPLLCSPPMTEKGTLSNFAIWPSICIKLSAINIVLIARLFGHELDSIKWCGSPTVICYILQILWMSGFYAWTLKCVRWVNEQREHNSRLLHQLQQYFAKRSASPHCGFMGCYVAHRGRSLACFTLV